MEHYQYVCYLGEGANGEVHEAVDKRNGEKVAIKKCTFNVPKSRDVQDIKEVRVMQALAGHLNVLTLKDAVIEEATAHLILELMEESLKNRIEDGGITFSEIRSFSWQLLSGIAHIHKSGFLHLDLKPANILLDDTNILKICDFGAAYPYRAGVPVFEFRAGTHWYSAPETIDFTAEGFGPTADLWSAGCIIAELYTGKPLFRANDYDEVSSVITAVLGCDIYTNLEELLDGAPADLIDLVAKLLNPDPLKRPSAKEALQHRLFDPIQWSHASLDPRINSIEEIELQISELSI